MRIRDTTLITVSLITSALGIIGLIIVSATTDTITTMTHAQTLPDETTVTLNTTIRSVNHYGNITFLELEDTCTLPAVIFAHVDVQPARAIITGTITTHDGEREIIVERIQQNI